MPDIQDLNGGVVKAVPDATDLLPIQDTQGITRPTSIGGVGDAIFVLPGFATAVQSIAGTGGGGGGGNLFALTYASNGDANGVISLLQGAWQLSASGVFAGYSLAGALDPSDTALINNFASLDVAGSWWRIQFPGGMRVNKYTIRSRGDANTEHLRSWKLQGSHGGLTWTDLDTQSSNTSINSIGAYFSSSSLANTVYWRFLRILQTGVNSSGSNFLTMGGIEFYGSYAETV